MSRVVHFDIHADDVERARAFYENVFGWVYEKTSHGDYWLSKTGPDDKPGINGALLKRAGPVASGGFSSYVSSISVDDIDAHVKRVEEHKGNCIRPKYALPGIGWHCHCIDTEGNMFGLIQYDPTAA